MAKFGKKIMERIVGLIKSDTFSIAEICQQVGITSRTFHRWTQDYPAFAEAIEQARDERMQQFVIEAKKSLLKKIQGYEITETKTVVVPGENTGDGTGTPKPVIKEQTTIKKHIQPDTAAIIFTLTNGDPEHWRNRQTTEVTGSDGEPLFVPKITDKMIEEYLKSRKK